MALLETFDLRPTRGTRLKSRMYSHSMHTHIRRCARVRAYVLIYVEKKEAGNQVHRGVRVDKFARGDRFVHMKQFGPLNSIEL